MMDYTILPVILQSEFLLGRPLLLLEPLRDLSARPVIIKKALILWYTGRTIPSLANPNVKRRTACGHASSQLRYLQSVIVCKT